MGSKSPDRRNIYGQERRRTRRRQYSKWLDNWLSRFGEGPFGDFNGLFAIGDDEPEDTDLGECPNCGGQLSSWGAASHGDGDIYDEIGCDFCGEVIDERHASYCTCAECDPYGLKAGDTDETDSRFT